MNRRLFLVSALALAPAAALAQSEHATYSGKRALPDTGGIDPKTDPRVVAVTSTLACNCGTCPHEPVNVCTCAVATRMRAEVAAMISKGKDGPVARAQMIADYGYGIVAAPPFAGINLIAWIGPFVLIGVVAVVLWAKLADWKKTSASKTDAAVKDGNPSSSAPSDPYLARIEAELQRGESR